MTEKHILVDGKPVQINTDDFEQRQAALLKEEMVYMEDADRRRLHSEQQRRAAVEAPSPPVERDLTHAKKDAPVATGTKFDGIKPAYGLLPTYALELAAAGFAIGAEKYTAWNWTGGLPPTRLAGALLRHLHAFMAGEEIDAVENGGSGLPHMAGMLCSAMMLAECVVRHPELDDRAPRSAEVLDAIRAVRETLELRLGAIRAAKTGAK